LITTNKLRIVPILRRLAMLLSELEQTRS